ncbi:MAG: DEAD/DEAH box helicase [Elusimicrobia bacterium]|nr:DEAD/DEAH box helicase [Elusimicrobiota bacterium]
MPFSKLGLHPDLTRAAKSLGFIEPTPIQAQAIPLALKGEDLLGCAQTGSGKTAAFAFPILHHLLEHPRPGLRVLILVPTRELAAQVEKMFSDCGRFTPFKTAVVIGGVSYHGQRQSLAQGLVLDEADRMLDMGFLPDIRNILSRLPRQRQTMLFSATLAPEVEHVAAFALHHPHRIEISRPTSVAEGISQVIYPITQTQKTEFLIAWLKATQIHSGLIFCRTKHGADRLATRLNALGFSVGVIHSNRSQPQRTAAMDSFRAGRTKLLVATDIAARGIDVRQISHVINYDLPRHPEDYVHRVGRTARAYGVGDAITLMAPDEQTFLTAIERFTGATFPRAVLPDFPYQAPPMLAPPKPKTLGQIRWKNFRRSFRRSR